MKCDYKILHHNEHGYVVRCERCQKIKLAFGTCALTMGRSKFSEFVDTVQKYIDVTPEYGFPHQKRIQIPTTCSEIQLVYTTTEVKNLYDLVEEAYLSLEIEQLFS